jgi:hypothetical protein
MVEESMDVPPRVEDPTTHCTTNEEVRMAPLIVKDVAIPVELDKTFVAPDLEKALRFYPEWVRLSRCPWSVAGFLCDVMREIDKSMPNGYTGDKALAEFMRWAGLELFSELMAQKSGRPTVRLMV